MWTFLGDNTEAQIAGSALTASLISFVIIAYATERSLTEAQKVLSVAATIAPWALVFVPTLFAAAEDTRTQTLERNAARAEARQTAISDCIGSGGDVFQTPITRQEVAMYCKTEHTTYKFGLLWNPKTRTYRIATGAPDDPDIPNMWFRAGPSGAALMYPFIGF